MRHTRFVERATLHGEAVTFRELCRRAVPAETRFLVLDLDRTVHLGRNMGELLGWEICAWHAYGAARLDAVERRRPGRFFLDRTRPLALLRYLALGARMWAYPGLFYLFCGKLPSRSERLRRWAYRTFGKEPVAAVQRVPQIALMHHMAAVPSADLRRLARGVWDRYRDDQVIGRDDLDWLRQRSPGLRIVIASASPQPTLEVAAEALGADAFLASTLEEKDGWFSSPYQLHPLFLQGQPRRISPPSLTRMNSGRTKIERLHARWPELADPATVSVGITDTGYGEDHCWADHLTRVIDVNGADPFPPIVSAGSPLRELHSASVLSAGELARREAGAAGWLDPRRRQAGAAARAFAGADLERAA
ncbi:MAG TPA: haloacid dehalogenase-like hydrolase, partial [Anaeromyxobacteraceae bacterium]|nr:haloacid dehalogenase-like hydrolase [Anaeromyxobacteraceae bacterium]